MRKLLLTILLGASYLAASHAQISYGGTPPSFEYPQTMRSTVQTYRLDASGIDTKELVRQDEIAGRNGSPMRIAVCLPAEVDINTTGEWTTLPNGERIWRQTLSAPGAKGMIVSYEEFRIPEGGKLFIYNADQSQVIGSFTEKTNPRGGRFSTQLVYGEEITLEYVESTISTEQPRLKVEDVGYVFFRSEEEIMELHNPTTGRSADCMIDINCPEGDNWQDQKRGVVQLHYKAIDGSSWMNCTGSLINNTAFDATPYVLTAHHCFFNPMLQDNQSGDFETAQVNFHYEARTCGETITRFPDYVKTLVGSELLYHEVYKNGSDGLLMRLTEDVPLEWEPYFNGWDVSGATPLNGVTIHHPESDVKKISTFNGRVMSSRYNDAEYTNWWRVMYVATETAYSVTAVGSSGAPLFNQNGLITGTLTGGNSYCEGDPRGGPASPDYFGKLSAHFTGYGYEGQEGGIKPYLDPLNKGLTSLAGYDPNRDVSIQQEKTNSGAELIIFPNPAETEININANSIIRNVYVFDMRGQQLHETKGYTASTFTLNIATWEKGIYTIVIETEKGRYSEKIIKQ